MEGKGGEILEISLQLYYITLDSASNHVQVKKVEKDVFIYSIVFKNVFKNGSL
jgi:hypothetical protein